MKVLLLGIGRANISVARYLIKRGDSVYLYDEHKEALSDEAKTLMAKGDIHDYKDMHYDLVVSSPGFSETNPIIQHLRGQGMDVIDETEFTYQVLNNPKVIAVTGTNGKSTTVGLISAILTASGIKNFMGGNIAPGQPFSATLFQERYAYYVLEMSSFQLVRIRKFRPFIAVLTNITVDHLNWHRNFNDYINAKSQIFRNQIAEDFAVLNQDDENTQKILDLVHARIIFFGINSHQGAWLNGMLNFQEERIMTVGELPLAGAHNQLNALAAIAVAKVLNISNHCIREGLKNFKSLPHRLEEVAVIDGIRYINNSMSTNEASAIASFRAISGNKIVIIGGREKGDHCEKYLALLVKEAKGIVILGENAESIARVLENWHYQNYEIAQDMHDAVIRARKFAEKGDIIMLNPGFASFGHFRDFQERGEAFKNAII